MRRAALALAVVASAAVGASVGACHDRTARELVAPAVRASCVILPVVTRSGEAAEVCAHVDDLAPLAQALVELIAESDAGSDDELERPATAVANGEIPVVLAVPVSHDGGRRKRQKRRCERWIVLDAPDAGP